MKYLAPFLVIFVIFGCSNKGTDSGISKDQILPVAVGNNWSFVERPVGGYTSDTSTYTLTIIKDTMMTSNIGGIIDIGRWYRVTGQAGMLPTYYADRANGHWKTFFFNNGQNNISVVSLTAKYPAVVGDTFSRLYPPPLDGGSQNVEVISSGASVTVETGTFSCVGYRVTLRADGRRQADYYYSLGVGLVKINHYDLAPADSSITRETRLTGYTIK